MVDLVEKLPPVLAVERRTPRDKLVKNRAQTPPVDSLTMTTLVDNFRSEVFGGATDRKGLIVGLDVALAEPEVSELDVPILADENVLWLEAESGEAYSL